MGGVILLSTFIPYSFVNNTHLGLLIGTTAFYCFPVLQYFPIYLLGQSDARGFTSKVTNVLIILLMSSALLYAIYQGKLPNRFPPSLGFILIGLGASRLYKAMASSIYSSLPSSILKELKRWGTNTLDLLVLSNISIFGLYDVFRVVGIDFSIFNSTLAIIVVLCICRIYLILK